MSRRTVRATTVLKVPSRRLVGSYLPCCSTEGKKRDTSCWCRQERASFFFFNTVPINVKVSLALTWAAKESDKARAAGAPNGR